MALFAPFPTDHPVDLALVSLGSLVRRGRNQSLTPADLAELATTLEQQLADSGADPEFLLRARLKMLCRAGRDETLTFDQFEAITGSIRRQLQIARGDIDRAQLRKTPMATAASDGVVGRAYGRLTVFDGGRATPNPTERSL